MNASHPVAVAIMFISQLLSSLVLLASQNFAHHLIGARRLTDMLQLLSDPTWLESKLHAYGIASVVQDFRRCVCWDV